MPSAEVPEVLCRLRGVSRAFAGPDGPVEVLAGVDLDVAAGSRHLVTGASGAGKTTLLCILGLVDTDFTGAYALRGRDAQAASERERAGWRLRVVGSAFQDIHLVPSLTVEENLLLPAEAAGQARDDAARRVRALLEAAGIAGRAHHRPAALSGGERRRAALARALVNRPALLLLDEPTAGLDPASRAGVLRLVEGAWREGAAVVVATHEPHLFPGQRWRLEGGRLVPAPDAPTGAVDAPGAAAGASSPQAP